MKKQRKTKRTVNRDIAATTTSKNWGFGAISGKGGKTLNHEIQESMFQRELRELNKGLIEHTSERGLRLPLLLSWRRIENRRPILVR